MGKDGEIYVVEIIYVTRKFKKMKKEMIQVKMRKIGFEKIS